MQLSGSLARITTFVLVVGLFATPTNLIPLSVLPFVWLALILPLLLLRVPRIPKVTAWAILYYFASIASLIAYDPGALITPDFYRYDGNFLVSFLPLLALPLLRDSRLNVQFWVKGFVVFSVSISALVAWYQSLTAGYATGLFVATNAFGGFLMSVIAFSFSWLLTNRNKYPPLLFLTISLSLLILSTSRGSFFGILLGIFSYIAIRYERRWIVLMIISSIVVVQGLIISQTYSIYLAEKENAFNLAYEVAESSKEANIYVRAFENWPRGVYLFFQSPIVGAGVGAANDVPFVFSDDTIVQLNASDERIYNSAHAHNTYLHILGEQGLVGLLMFLAMWVALYKEIYRRNDGLMVRDGLLIIFWALTFSSFTEHRIPSPSNVFPFLLAFLLYYRRRSAGWVIAPEAAGSKK